MTGPLLLAARRLLLVTLITSAVCAVMVLATVLAVEGAGGGSSLVGDAAVVGALGGALAGSTAVAARAFLDRRGASARLDGWAQPLLGGLSAGVGAYALTGPGLWGAGVGLVIFLIAAGAVHETAPRRCSAAPVA